MASPFVTKSWYQGNHEYISSADMADLEKRVTDYTDQNTAVQFKKIVSTIPPVAANGFNAIPANGAIGGRILWPETGTINALAVFIGTTSGNIDIGVYDTNGASRTRLASFGTVAAGGANAYQSVVVSLPVVKGNAADLMLAADNATVTFAMQGAANAAQLILPAGWLPVAGAATPNIAPALNGAAFPLPNPITEASFAANVRIPLILARYA
jgi:hypothetical protein